MTGDDKYPITRGLLVFEGVYGSDWPKLAAATIMLMIPMLVLYIFLQRYISGLTLWWSRADLNDCPVTLKEITNAFDQRLSGSLLFRP